MRSHGRLVAIPLVAVSLMTASTAVQPQGGGIQESIAVASAIPVAIRTGPDDCSAAMASTFWDHTRCKAPASCCTTDWGTEGPDDCCHKCQQNTSCAAWEWYGDDADGPACYYCTSAVLPFRTHSAAVDSTHLTGCAGDADCPDPRPAASDGWPIKPPPPRRTPLRAAVTKAVSYASGSGDRPTEFCEACSSCQCLDWYRPAPPRSAAKKLVVFFHGGLWFSGSRSEISDVCGSLADDHGVDCVTADYRYSQDLGGCCNSVDTCVETYSAQAKDLVAAIRKAVHLTGVRYGQVYVGGHSAGGHLSLLLALEWATLAGLPRPAGFFGVEGIYNATLWDDYDTDHWGGRFKCQTRQCFGDRPGSAAWTRGSPVAIAAAAAPVAPTLLVHSPGDNWVQSAQAVALHAVLKAPAGGGSNEIDTSGECVSGQHPDVLNGASAKSLAGCIVSKLITPNLINPNLIKP